MFKSVLCVAILFSGLACADEQGSKAECKARCWGAPKVAEAITQGINTVLNQKENKTGAYQKKFTELKDRLHKSERNFAAMRMLEDDSVSNIPRFSTMLIRKEIAKKTNANMCFKRCGSARLRAGQPIDFMQQYFMTVITSMTMEDLKKAFLYYGTPFDTYDTQKMLDEIAKEMPQDKFDVIIKDAKDVNVANFIKTVRTGQNSFENLRPEPNI